MGVAQALPKSFLAQDLLSLFGLQPLAASVARTDPVTGEKINKMRKSYEGKVKNFKISGKARAAQHHPEHGMSLSDMVRWPEEEWNNQKVFGKLVMSGLPPATTMKLEKVMQMQPGPIPNGASWHSTSWEEIIGIEKSKPIPAGPDPRAKSAVSAAKTNGYVNGNRPYAINTQATNSEAARPKRTAKKRRYDDLSFEGYGEGYVDDEADIVDAGGYSSGDGGSKSGASKKRKMVGISFSDSLPRFANISSRQRTLGSPAQPLVIEVAATVSA